MGFKRAGFKLYPALGLFDASTGRYLEGKDGGAYLNGGLTHFEGICGLPNTFKTTLTLFKFIRILTRIKSSTFIVYDTEGHFRELRVTDLLGFMSEPGADEVLANIDDRFVFTDVNTYYGDEWFEVFKKLAAERAAKPKSEHLTTPFIDHRTKKSITSLDLLLFFMDSMSELTSKDLDEKGQAVVVGDKKLNMADMNAGRLKSQLIRQLMGVNTASGMYLTATASVGEKYQLDPYAQNINKLRGLGNDLKLKKVPETFMTLTQSCWFCYSHKALTNAGDRAPEFPRKTDRPGEQDLQVVMVRELRGKGSPSGGMLELVISQSEGLKPHLTHFLFLKSRGRFGIGGNNTTFHLDLMPDVSMTRKSIRELTESNYALSRAMDFTTDLCILKNDTPRLDPNMIPTPKELYEGLTKKGYDWDILYNTRGYWTFEEDKHPLNHLSTMDLVRMYHGFMHPKWYPKTAKEMGIEITHNVFGIG